MSTPDIFTDWKPTDGKQKGVVLASTLRWLRDRILKIEAQGVTAEGIDRAVPAADGRSFHFVTTAERELVEIPLATAPIRYRGDGHVAGSRYDEGDWWFDAATRSSYIALVDHTASVTAGADLAGGKYGYLARGGRDAQTYVGVYDAARGYVLGDVIQTGTAGVDAKMWQAFADIPAGIAPGADYRWGAVSLVQERDVKAVWRGAIAVGDVVLSELSLRGFGYNAGFGQSRARLSPAPAAATSFDIRVDGTVVGTLTFAANATAGTWAATGGLPFGGFVFAGSLVEVVAKTAVTNAASVLHVGIFGY